MVYTIFSVIILILLTIHLLSVLVKVFALKRQERILFVKGYKKGQFAFIFYLAVPLVILGYLYKGTPWYQSIFLSMANVVNFALLRFDFSPMQALMQSNAIYEIAVYYSFALIWFNSIMFVFSVIGQFIFESSQNFKFAINKGEKLYIFGCNDDNKIAYLNSKIKSKVIIDNLSGEDRFLLYVKNYNYYNVKVYGDKINDVIKTAIKSKNKIDVIINTKCDEKNIKLCEKFISLLNNEYSEAILFDKLRVFVYGNNNYESIYQEIEKTSKGIIQYVNKYRLVANDFIKKYPLSLFLNETQIDYNSATIYSDVEINFSIIGFGKTGSQLFLSSVENNQFITKIDNEITIKKVNYYLYDQNDCKCSKQLNHTYFRYVDDFDFDNKQNYLPLPQTPANSTFYKLNYCDAKFYDNIKESALNSKKSVNFVAVTLPNDLENIDVAKKICDKMREWGVENYYVFVRIENSKNNELVLKDDRILIIGNEDKIVYNVDEIINDEITKMAIKRNAVYELEYLLLNSNKKSITNEEYDLAILKSKYNWYATRLPLERNSNYSAVLSLRGKLNLIGYDLSTSSEKDDYLKFIKDYSKLDAIKYYKKSGVKSKKIVQYKTSDFKPSIRQNFAMLEHYRWSSYMIVNGFIPSTIEEILNNKTIKDGKSKFTNGKIFNQRKHGNLTTFEGLKKYAELISERDKISYEKADVIRYDYQILDDVGWLISETPYKIVKK